MKHIRNALALLLLVAAFATGNQVVVQAAGLACPTFTFGLVLTSGQWQACFDAKQNALGYVPVNKAGDTMTGKLILPASTITNASTNVPQGTAPTVPVNGDVWMTTAGLFVRTGGVTFGPLSSTPSYDKNGTRANPWHSVSGRATLSMGTVTLTLTGAAVFTSNATFNCLVQDTSGTAAATSITYTSGSSIALKGSGSNIVSYVCFGN